MTHAPVDWPTRDLLAHRTAATPDRTAVVDAPTGREWTYRAFDAVVDGTAAHLRARLEGTDTRPRIGVVSSTRIESVVAVHAVFRAGGCLVPLHARLSERELGAQLERVGPDLLVCESETETAALGGGDCPVVSLDTPDASAVDELPTVEGADGVPTFERRADAGKPASRDPDGTAVLLFTSGTTGQPKCVQLTLGNLVASATASAFRLGVSPDDRWLDCLPIYHMGGFAPLVRCSLYGTTLLVAEGFDTDRTADRLAGENATGVSLVPTQLTRLLDAGWQPPASLDTVLLGGAPAPDALVERALDAGVPVYPTYGLTEAASQAATATPAVARESPGSVGQPLVSTEVTVVDSDGTPLEAGETGEIVVDGPAVTPGYLDASRTAAAFGDAGLHTGDLGYRDGAGRLWVLGRVDDTIVTGGENVHPAEVEAVLCEHPDVAGAAVVGVADAEWGERVGALVVAPGSPTPAAIREFARDRLAGFKLPRTIDFATALPRTPSGTVDRQAVRELLAADGDRE